MHTRLLFLASIAALACTICLAPSSAAQSSPIHVLVSNGLKASMEDLHTACEASVGQPLDIRYNSTAGVKKSIEAGERFDVTMITTEAIDDLVKQGKLAGEGVDILGPLPAEFRYDIRFSAAAGSAVSDKQAARAVVACVAGSKATPVLKAKGIDRK